MQVIICIGGEIIEVIKRNRAQFNFSCSGCSRRYLPSAYRKVASSRMSRLVAQLRIIKLFIKGKFDAYVL